MDKQRAADPLFERMQRAVHANAAELHGFGGSGDIALRHKHHKDRQLAEGDLLVDIVFHSPSTLLVYFSFFNSNQYIFYDGKVAGNARQGREMNAKKGRPWSSLLFTARMCFYSAISCCGEASRGGSAGLAVAVGAAAGIWITGGLVSCSAAAVSSHTCWVSATLPFSF